MSHSDKESFFGFWLSPAALAAGVVLGLAVCSVAGHILARLSHFEKFSRFFIYIQPQTNYYPTISQLIATARVTATKEDILVVVGGSSIFRGTGQNPDELWTIDLQRHLGDGFVVLNYAIDQASITSFGGVAFRALSAIHPKIIFVSLSDYRGALGIDGEEPYRYLFWDAYYKSYLIDDDVVTAQATRAQQIKDAQGQENHIGQWLDSILFFRDLWSTIGYNWLFTVCSDSTALSPFLPRGSYRDVSAPNLKLLQQNFQQDEATRTLMVDRMKHLTSAFYPVYASGGDIIRDSYRAAFPESLRPRILVVDLSVNPAILSAMPDQYQRQLGEIGLRYAAILTGLGYNAMQIGGTLDEDDFADQGHLMASGGQKLAAGAAVEVVRLAERLGFLRQARPASLGDGDRTQ